MKWICLAVILFLSPDANAKKDSTETDATDFKRWRLSLNFSPDLTYRVLIYSGNDFFISDEVTRRNEIDLPRSSFTTGANIMFNFSNQIGVETGIQYSRKGYQVRIYDYGTYGDNIDPIDGFLPPDEKDRYVFNYNYLDIPVLLRVVTGSKKTRFSASAGIVTNILARGTLIKVQDDANGKQERFTILRDNHFMNIGFSPTIGIGVDYQLSKSFNLKLEPTFRYNLVSVDDTEIGEHLWSLGLNASIYY